MSFTEELFKLRQKFQDAIQKGVVSEDGKDIFEATLIQILNDAEKNRQNCVTQADNLRRQASVFDGQAAAFASVGSIVYGVINGFVMLADKAEKALELERSANDIPKEIKRGSKKKPTAAKQ